MGCYILSIASALLVYAIRRKRDSAELRTLNLLLLGGAIFGFIDHAWNNQLLLISAGDMMLGLAIVAGIFGSWAAMAYGHVFLKKDPARR